MTRTHFLFPAEPVTAWGSSIVAPCGAEVRNAVPKLLMEADTEWFNSSTVFVPSSLRGDCWRCVEKYNETRKETTGRLYLYGLIEGEEAMHSGDTIKNIEDVVTKHSRSLEITDSASGGESEKISTETR